MTERTLDQVSQQAGGPEHGNELRDPPSSEKEATQAD